MSFHISWNEIVFDIFMRVFFGYLYSALIIKNIDVAIPINRFVNDGALDGQRFFIAHTDNCLINGTSFFPTADKEYSTLGGTVSYDVRVTKLSFSSFFRQEARTFNEIPSIRSRSSVKRSMGCSSRIKMMSTDHLSPNRFMMVLKGHPVRQKTIVTAAR